ncbi:MAG: histidine kinase, partial [Nitrososphaerales archaeon]
RLLLTLGIPAGLVLTFLLADALAHALVASPWPETTHLLLAALLLVASSLILWVYRQGLARQAAARAIIASQEASYRALFDQFPEPITVWNCDGVLLMQNLISAHTLGGKREDYLGKTIVELFGPEAGSEYLARIERVFRTGAAEEQEDAVLLQGGQRHFWTVMRRIVQPDGCDAVQVISYDVTARVQAEAALRASESLRIQERSARDERQRLARELHDSVSQALYGIALGVNTALTVLDRDREAARAALNYSVGLARAGLSEMRALIFELRPESLESEGLVAAVLKTAEAVHARFEMPVNVEVCEEPDLSLAEKEALYRIAQEALHNAVKHSQSTEVSIGLACDEVRLTLTVRDNGIGFDPEGLHPGHLGLKSMRERAANVGAAIRIASKPGEGTLVEVQVPLAASRGEEKAARPAAGD